MATTAIVDGIAAASCLGSGYCCKNALCGLAVQRHPKATAPCPSLVLKDGRYWCGEVLAAEGEELQWLIDNLYIGAGCCSPLNTDRKPLLATLRREREL